MRKLLAAVFIFAVFLWAGLYWSGDLAKFFSNIETAKQEALNDALENIERIEREVIAPPPLRTSPSEALQGELSRAGVIRETNEERALAGLLPLRENVTLNAVATRKANDMFVRHYFAHESPSGEGVADLADDAGYAYILIGENLALGGWKSDEELVAGWMGSPGHRANILNGRYQEIGVAVQKGIYEGREVWIGVQEFGKPFGACPAVDVALKARIEANNAELDIRTAELEARKEELEQMEKSNRRAYNQKVEEYNALVGSYNALLSETKAMIAEYNAQVQAFNSCAQN